MDSRGLPQLPGSSERAVTPPRSIRELCASRPPFARVEVGTAHWQNNIEQRVQRIEKRIEKAAKIINQFYENHPVPTREVKSCLTFPQCQPGIADVAAQNSKNPQQPSSREREVKASKFNSRQSSSPTKLANASDSKYETCLEDTCQHVSYDGFQQGELLSSTVAGTKSSTQSSTQQSSTRHVLTQQASSHHAPAKENSNRDVSTQQASSRHAPAKENSNRDVSTQQASSRHAPAKERYGSFITPWRQTLLDTTLRPANASSSAQELSRSPRPKVSDERKIPKCAKGCKSKCAKRDTSEKRCTRKVKRH